MSSTALARAPGHIPVLPPSLRSAFLSLLSFEALLTLYMFAGLYKGDPRFDWITLDPTGLFFTLSVVMGILILVSRPLFWPGLYPALAGITLVTWFALSLFWSPSQVYGPDKVLYMATLVLWGLIAGAIIIAPDRARLRRLFMVLVVASLIAAIEAITVYLEIGGGTIRVGSGNYIALGRLCGLGAGIVFVAWLFSRRRFGPYGLVCLGLFGLFGFVLVIGGGRGPLIATVASLLLPLLAGVRTSRYGLHLARYQMPAIGLGLLAVSVLTIWISSSEQTPETLARLERLTNDQDPGSSVDSRASYYEAALGFWDQAPILGHGAGSWPLLLGRGDIPRHPHNLFAETVVEAGFVGLILLIGLLVIALRPVSIARMRGDPLSMCALMLFVNAFLNAMVSGDIPGNRVLFLLIGTLTVFALPQPARSASRRRRRSLPSSGTSPGKPDPGAPQNRLPSRPDPDALQNRLRWPEASP